LLFGSNPNYAIDQRFAIGDGAFPKHHVQASMTAA
jgi:hypothetical protein